MSKFNIDFGSPLKSTDRHLAKAVRKSSRSASQESPGIALPSSLLLPLALEQKTKPAFELIPCRAAWKAERAHGYGSPEHIEALRVGQLAWQAYIDGKGWPDPEYHPSLQQRVLCRREFEIAGGGARGGSKSAAGIFFLIAGNFYEPDFEVGAYSGRVVETFIHKVNQTYTNHPHYFGLCIRKNDKDLDDWIGEASAVYSKLGGEWKTGDRLFQFPSGAVIRTGHLADPNSYAKYIGKSIHRLVIEELIQLLDEKPYRELRRSVRSKFPELRPQVYVSFNPMGGPGVGWVFDRFIEPKRMLSDGRQVPIADLANNDPQLRVYNHDWTPKYPEPIIEEEVEESHYRRLNLPVPPLEQRLRKRVFIPAKLTDNPYLMYNFDYLNELTDGTKEEVDAYLYGIWSFGGSAFSDFRPKGPLPGEPSNANHVIPAYPKPSIVIHRPRPRTAPITLDNADLPPDLEALTYPSIPLQPWWHRLMGGDWGYEHEAVFLWGAHDPTSRRFHIYRERLFSQTVPEVVGAEIARDSIQDLNQLPSHSMSLYIGWDPSASERMGGERVLFNYIAKGIEKILGPGSVHIPDFIIRKIEEEAYEKSSQVDEQLIQAIKTQRRAGITIRRAFDSRVVGWQVCRSFLRFTPILLDSYENFDPEAALRILHEDGPERYRDYIAHVSKRSDIELLPRLQIWDSCPRLIEAIPKAQRDEKNVEDCSKKHVQGVSDRIDSFRYLITGFREEEGIEPAEAYVERKMSDLLLGVDSANFSVMDKIRIRNSLEAEYKAKSAPQIFHPRHLSAQRGIAARRELSKLLGGGREKS